MIDYLQIAEIAQLVERNLAKVEVAGPSPVFRSKEVKMTSFFVAQSDANKSKKILYINDMRDYFISGQSKGTHTKAGH